MPTALGNKDPIFYKLFPTLLKRNEKKHYPELDRAKDLILTILLLK